VPLLFPDTQVAPEAMAGMFRDFVQELALEHQLLESPPSPVEDPQRLALHCALLSNVLATVREIDPATLPREKLRQWVNIQYDVSQLAQDAMRTCLAMPKKRPPSKG
jgi:hypothetical protein